MTGGKIRDLWLLVKPDYAESLEPKDLEKYKRIIDTIAQDTRSVFIMVPTGTPGFPHSEREMEKKIREYARAKIPKERCMIRGIEGGDPSAISGKMKEKVDKNTRILACGAYLTHCVPDEASAFSEMLKIPKKNIFVLPRYSVDTHAIKFGSFHGIPADSKKYYRNALRGRGIPFQKVPSFEKRLGRKR
jgi:hypothetical protein